MAGPQDPAERRGGETQVEEERGAPGHGVRLGQLLGGHPEEGIGVHRFQQFLRGGRWAGGAVGARAVRCRGEQVQGGTGVLVRERAQPSGHDAEQPELVAGMADEELGSARATGGQRGPGRFGEYVAVDHGTDGDACLREPSPARPVAGEAGAECGQLVGQAPGVDVGERRGRRRRAEPAGERRGDLFRQRTGAVPAGHRVGDGPPEEAARRPHRQQRGDRPRSGGLPGHGDVAGVPSERGDVPPHPVQCRDLVEESTVGRDPFEEGEALGTHSVVDAHHDEPGPGQCRRVVHRVARRPRYVGAPVDPHQHRQSRRARIGSAHVQRQPVGAVRRTHTDRTGLRDREAELRGLPRPFPGRGRSGCGETEVSHRRPGVRDAAEHRVPRPAATPHNTFRGARRRLFEHVAPLPPKSPRLYQPAVLCQP